MKFLVDECVGHSVAQWLNQNNFDAISIYDATPGINDNLVLKQAFSENRILITSDKDFGEMIFKNNQEHCGILLLRLIDERPANKIQILSIVLQNHAQDLMGNFVVATEKTIRITKLFLAH